MKVRVIKSFIDKETKKVRALKEEFDCTEKRFAEIEKKGHYVEKVAETPKKEG